MYKKGDKFILEIEDVYQDWVNSIDEKEPFYKLKNLSAISLRECHLNNFNKIDETKIYEQGLEDAWEIIKKISFSHKSYDGALRIGDMLDIFGTVDVSEILKNFTAAEAIAKIKKHEEQVINVGDEVIGDPELLKGDAE